MLADYEQMFKVIIIYFYQKLYQTFLDLDFSHLLDLLLDSFQPQLLSGICSHKVRLICMSQSLQCQRELTQVLC